MTESEIKAGDVVQLKTGGPLMVVRWCEKEGDSSNCYCDWFSKEGEPRGSKFALVQLRKMP